MSGQASLGFKSIPSTEKDLFLCHNGADKPWVEMLAERIEEVPFGSRTLAIVFDQWDFDKGGNFVLDMEKYLDTVRFVGVVVSRAMREVIEELCTALDQVDMAVGGRIEGAGIEAFTGMGTALCEFQQCYHSTRRRGPP
jgi:hypothetical protein